MKVFFFKYTFKHIIKKYNIFMSYNEVGLNCTSKHKRSLRIFFYQIFRITEQSSYISLEFIYYECRTLLVCILPRVASGGITTVLQASFKTDLRLSDQTYTSWHQRPLWPTSCTHCTPLNLFVTCVHRDNISQLVM